jgi:hypothetical protein
MNTIINQTKTKAEQKRYPIPKYRLAKATKKHGKKTWKKETK